VWSSDNQHYLGHIFLHFAITKPSTLTAHTFPNTLQLRSKLQNCNCSKRQKSRFRTKTLTGIRPEKMEPFLPVLVFSFIGTIIAMWSTRQREDETDHDYQQRCAEAEVPVSLYWPPG